jgi:hypothetical protein
MKQAQVRYHIGGKFSSFLSFFLSLFFLFFQYVSEKRYSGSAHIQHFMHLPPDTRPFSGDVVPHITNFSSHVRHPRNFHKKCALECSAARFAADRCIHAGPPHEYYAEDQSPTRIAAPPRMTAAHAARRLSFDIRRPSSHPA